MEAEIAKLRSETQAILQSMHEAHNQMVEGMQRDFEFLRQRADRQRGHMDSDHRRIRDLERADLGLRSAYEHLQGTVDAMEARLCRCGNARHNPSLAGRSGTPEVGVGSDRERPADTASLDEAAGEPDMMEEAANITGPMVRRASFSSRRRVDPHPYRMALGDRKQREALGGGVERRGLVGSGSFRERAVNQWHSHLLARRPSGGSTETPEWSHGAGGDLSWCAGRGSVSEHSVERVGARAAPRDFQ